ncbi:hypothetical protein BDR05DRAFT_461300 [Suillus weaverae]|nr:hypothetical protein BDR05DRAFT_461300 [Suillus weaverae]
MTASAASNLGGLRVSLVSLLSLYMLLWRVDRARTGRETKGQISKRLPTPTTELGPLALHCARPPWYTGCCDGLTVKWEYGNMTQETVHRDEGRA